MALRNAFENVSTESKQDSIITLLTSIEALETSIDTNIADIETLITSQNSLITTTNSKLDTVNTNLGAVNTSVQAVDASVDDVETAVNTVNATLGTPRQESGHGSANTDRTFVEDSYPDGETLADQSGADAVLTFTFSSDVQLIVIRSDGGDSRADPFGGTPSASAGIPCKDDEPNYIPATATTVKIYAPTGATVSVWGFRYA